MESLELKSIINKMKKSTTWARRRFEAAKERIGAFENRPNKLFNLKNKEQRKKTEEKQT